MNPLATGLAAAGMVSVLAGWAGYMATISEGRVPERPTATFVLTLGGAAVAVVGVALAAKEAAWSAATLAPAGFAVFMAGFFAFLFSIRRVPEGNLQVEVGEPLLPFEAKRADGSAFSTDDLKGKRVLLKFFRGSW
ncbi:MAG TPA: hypothetical protein ENK57_23695 [Polyangiaceae bacterium]|nr:hypothetical protein [Polyangiaceae bacterium]